MADPELRVRRAGAGDVDALLTISSGLWAEDAGTHDPEVMNTDWPQQHGRASFEALVDAFLDWARDRGAPYAVVTAFAANTGAQRFYGRRGFAPHTVTLRQPL